MNLSMKWLSDFVKLKVSDTSGVSLDCELCEDTKE